MMSHFKPWRRKLGAAMLALTCMLWSGWMRSLDRSEELRIGGNGHTLHLFMSTNGWLAWIIRHESRSRNPRAIPPIWSSESGVGDYTPFSRCNGDGEFIGIINPHMILPYDVIVVPLTLLSAWLLLSKPPVRKPVPDANPFADEE